MQRNGRSLLRRAAIRPGEGSGAEMPTVLRWGPYRAFFYSADNAEPAHVHVRSGDMEAKFWLHDLTVAVNAGFRPHQIESIIGHLRTHQAELMDAWNEHFGN